MLTLEDKGYAMALNFRRLAKATFGALLPKLLRLQLGRALEPDEQKTHEFDYDDFLLLRNIHTRATALHAYWLAAVIAADKDPLEHAPTLNTAYNYLIITETLAALPTDTLAIATSTLTIEDEDEVDAEETQNRRALLFMFAYDANSDFDKAEEQARAMAEATRDLDTEDIAFAADIIMFRLLYAVGL